MTDNVVHLQPAFILQQRKYRETSLIINVLTRDFGRLSLLAKGVRKPKSKTAGLLQAFVPLNISYLGKAELKTLTDIESIAPSFALKGLALYCGFYVNELIGLFLHQYDPHPDVFTSYRKCLSGLAATAYVHSSTLRGDVARPPAERYNRMPSDSSQIEAALRIFELELMENVGYGLQLEYDAGNEQPIDSSKKYRFNQEQGLIEDGHGLFSGTTIYAIRRKEFTDPKTLCETKLLMRAVIDHHLQGRPLKSRAVINQIIKNL